MSQKLAVAQGADIYDKWILSNTQEEGLYTLFSAKRLTRSANDCRYYDHYCISLFKHIIEQIDTVFQLIEINI